MTLKTSARLTSALLAALPALALMAALAAGPARAADDGSGDLIDVAKSLLLYGSPNDDKPAIDYRERAPLVLPKDRAALPSPSQRTRPGNWPNDPDVAARAAAAAEARAPRSGDKDRDTRMSAAELAKGVGNGDTGLNAEKGCRTSGGGTGGCLWMNPDRLREIGVKREEKNRIPVGSEPDRAYLTQPPKGYRKVTQETGGGVAKPIEADDTPKVREFFRNPFGKKDDDE